MTNNDRPTDSRERRPFGVLIANTGSPDSPNFWAVRRYLAQFLSDRRVIDLPRWVWLPLLHGIILNVRPARSGRLYRKIWTENGSPLVGISQKIAAGVSSRLSALLEAPVPVAAGMRYGNPTIASALRSLRQESPERLIILPLFPQYSGTTTGSILDAVFRELRSWSAVPQVQLLTSYYDFPPYIQALKNSILTRWERNGRADQLLFSFHGIPQSYAERGDPYPEQCLTTARLTAEALGIDHEHWRAAFQSRFGPQSWLQPYTQQVLENLGKKGQERLSVICPGFAADCLETLEEIAELGKRQYEISGGSGFDYIPALNTSPAHLEALCELILGGKPSSYGRE